jgi:hypothetical protein
VEEPYGAESAWYAANPNPAAVVLANGAEQATSANWAEPDSYPDASAGGDLTFPALYPDPAAMANDCVPEEVEQPDVLPVPALSRFGTFLNGREAWLGRSGQ